MAIALNGLDGNAFTSRDVDASASNFVYAQGLLGFSGSYVTGGDTIDFTTIIDRIASAQILSLSVGSQGGLLTAQYVPVKGSGLNNWKLKISSGTFGTELAAGAYPGAITGDTVVWYATFRKLQ